MPSSHCHRKYSGNDNEAVAGVASETFVRSALAGILFLRTIPCYMIECGEMRNMSDVMEM